jgi:hypothetical protein
MIKVPTHFFSVLDTGEDGKYSDDQNEVIPFLKSLYNYEKERVPIHNMFNTVVGNSPFDPTLMLNYWMNGDIETKVEYRFLDLPDEPRPVILKRTFVKDAN